MQVLSSASRRKWIICLSEWHLSSQQYSNTLKVLVDIPSKMYLHFTHADENCINFAVRCSYKVCKMQSKCKRLTMLRQLSFFSVFNIWWKSIAVATWSFQYVMHSSICKTSSVHLTSIGICMQCAFNSFHQQICFFSSFIFCWCVAP